MSPITLGRNGRCRSSSESCSTHPENYGSDDPPRLLGYALSGGFLLVHLSKLPTVGQRLPVAISREVFWQVSRRTARRTVTRFVEHTERHRGGVSLIPSLIVFVIVWTWSISR